MQIRNIALGYKIYLSQVAFSDKMSRLMRIIKLKLNRRIPLSLQLGLTYECQCKCEYCGVGSYRPLQGEEALSLNEIKKLTDGFDRLGLFNVTLTGGEPLLRKDLPEIASQISSKGIFVTLNTNGLLLDLERTKELKRAGVELVKVSLDSATPERHDAVRGVKGCFQRVTEAIENCLNLRIPCIIAFTLTKRPDQDIASELLKIISWGKEMGVTAIKVQPPRYSGLCYKKEDLLLNDEEMGGVENYMKPGFIYSSAFYNKLNECPFLNKDDCYVSPFGDVQPCVFIPIRFGHVLEEALPDIWRRMNKFMMQRFSGRSCMLSNDKLKNKIAVLSCDGVRLPRDIREISFQ